ncbi:helix-turn-helix transcriptional regulator [Streptomyces pathocidini]|uniref:helix-turn-helix domain-containing protein n=1 Tax=Streptomyces pathocidini TaxID=1650571 RepID=UPI0033E46B60
MPPRNQPTDRQERLGTELRKLREHAGMTARQAATLLGTNPIQMSAMEAGRSGVSEARVRSLAGHYACDDTDLVDALVAMATERGKGWWEEYRGVLGHTSLDIAELEHHATHIREFEVIHIPGLLQTEDHARAAFSFAAAYLPPKQMDAQIAFRLQRQDVISGTEFTAVIHEAALRIKVGGRKAALVQLERILEASDRDNVTVQVVPFSVDNFAAAGYSMILASGPVPQLDTVLLDTPDGSIFLDAEAQLRKYRSLFERVQASALPAAESRSLITGIAQDI